MTQQDLAAACAKATAALLAELNDAGHWEGELSSSALSTATATIALGKVDADAHAALIASGLRWLAQTQNADGGWGDTTKSRSNISTTALCWAAFGAAGADAEFPQAVAAAERWLHLARGAMALPEAIAARYGKDRTFSVPILMTLALSGRIGWEHVITLPFELAALPHKVFGALQLPVVSYALPALIAIGQTIHHHHPSRNRLARLIRELTRGRTLRVLESIQPDHGGFLEATPLTSFVTMSLAAMGLADHRVAQRGASFLQASARPDGSWPIDTNLATWTTTLAIKALAHQPAALSPEQRLTLREWLLGQQYRREHPYTHAAPGGWAWTDLPGGVPDADDTPGALLALLELGTVDAATHASGIAGIRWLLDLQNRDGGIPTFCRGWGALPFDRSSPDLTAHTLRAWSAWLPQLDGALKRRALRGIARALRFLARTQRADGSWLPLWFGNEHATDDENPIYGTAHVLLALRELRLRGFAMAAGIEDRALAFLAHAQQPNGGWSGAANGPASIERNGARRRGAFRLSGSRGDRARRSVARRARDRRHMARARADRFYFAKLWYYDRLYPLIWTTGALGKVHAAQRLISENAAAILAAP